MIVLAVYILAAVLPAVILMRDVYRRDSVEQEPVGLVGKLVLCGVGAAIIAGVAEPPVMAALRMFVDPESKLYTVLTAFFAVALVEEGAKFLVLKQTTWNDPHFNYRFDGIVYAVAVSLGFAAIENVIYVFQYGLSVAFTRALLAVPGHMAFGVFMGMFYGRAKLCADYGDEARCRRNLWAGYLLAMLHHGFYDACALLDTNVSLAVFIAFVILMFLTVRVIVRREAATDTPV
ncbi:MAG: PrsW family intramembrane metalloprotease [Oscillibacter sp.]|nr:PrsW family intramembrane metalloprotease [Oscillibacter sp.]